MAAFTTVAAARDSVQGGHAATETAQAVPPAGTAEPIVAWVPPAKPLAFVNRHAEALDVLVPNLDNTEAIDARNDLDRAGDVGDSEHRRIKPAPQSPLAVQLAGTGATALGLHLMEILRRPRDPPDVEKILAERLKEAGCFALGRKDSSYVDQAFQSAENENLVVRTLLALFPAQRDLLLNLKRTKPVLLRMRELASPCMGFSFDTALGYAIYCSARGMQRYVATTHEEFLALDPVEQTAAGAVEALMRERRGSPVLLIFDDISVLAGPRFLEYFESECHVKPLYRAMSTLSRRLQVLHGVRGCFIYLTGPLLLSRSILPLSDTRRLFVTPMLLQPLSSTDVRQTMRLTRLPGGTPLEDAVGVREDQLQHFAEVAVRLTGGMGLLLQYLLRTQASFAQDAAWQGKPRALCSAAEVDTALEEGMKSLSNIGGLRHLRVLWDWVEVAVNRGELPAWLRERCNQLQVLQFLARLTLLDVHFRPIEEWSVGGLVPARVVDLAMALGIHYVRAGDSDRVRLHASTWLWRNLGRELEHSHTLTTVRMLQAMSTCGGTMRERPFEMMCADALCVRHMMLGGAYPVWPDSSPSVTTVSVVFRAAAISLGDLLPHCNGSKLGAAALPQLHFVAVPKVAQASALDEVTKAELCASQRPWADKDVIHKDDLPWLLTKWLPEGSLALPSNAQSGSQDMFLRVPGGVVGFALKAVAATNATQWKDLDEELAKAPTLPAGESYVLVLWSLHLGDELQAALQAEPYAVFGPGQWGLRNNALCKDVHHASAKFIVPAGVQLVIANPHAPSGGGLAEILGPRLLKHCLERAPGSLADVSSLAAWQEANAPAALHGGGVGKRRRR